VRISVRDFGKFKNILHKSDLDPACGIPQALVVYGFPYVCIKNATRGTVPILKLA